MKRWLYAAGLALMLSGQVKAATFYFSTVGKGGAPTAGNPSITVNVGETVKLYLWAELSLVDETTSPGLDVACSDINVVDPTQLEVENPMVMGATNIYRWLGPVAMDLAEPAGFQATVGKSGGITAVGLNGSFASDPTRVGDSFLIGAFSFVGTAAGTADLFLTVNESMINGSVTGTPTSPSLHFGTEDAALPVDLVNARYVVAAGRTSSAADATIAVVPEPATMGLLAAAGAMLLWRRS
jgi:hypothetical protein